MQKSIGLQEKTYKELLTLKKKGQSFDGVIQTLIDSYKVTTPT